MVLFPIDYSDRKPLGKTGEKISAIGIGTWGIRDYRRAEEALVRAVELGLNMIDTAEMYDNGRAEELVGRVVSRVGRDRVFITTKLMPKHFIDRYKVIKAAKASLRRLGIRMADLILIHWPHHILSIAQQIRALEVLIDEGLTRYIGVSNFNRSDLEEALTSMRKYEIVVDQVKYSIYDRDVENTLLPYVIHEGITIQAYTPLERGVVAYDGKLKAIGSKYGKSAVQVALNFLISRPYVTAIPKTERRERVDEFKSALGWRLNASDIEFIENKLY
ncbi:MAG TPA: aldo/keto reductase [Acidilobales archaeon]|nr:MAG: oxidoreductase [Desulfurococcales archaeon ex4484_42]HDD26794.1 aldo/keto reductase [Acidilobales archaeon]